MDIRNYFLKRKQLKAIKTCIGDINYYLELPYLCPKCYFGTDCLSDYIIHLENHLNKKKLKERFERA